MTAPALPLAAMPDDDLPGGLKEGAAPEAPAAGDYCPAPAKHEAVPVQSAPVQDQEQPPASPRPLAAGSSMYAFLALAADILDGLEKERIANENRLRQLTRTEADADGEMRGFGLDESHPDVARLAALVSMLQDAEKAATLNLQRLMKNHPLGPWVKAQKGIGEKQGARLIAAIGDPYIRPEITRADGTAEPSRPRKVSELWAYCGYHVVPAGGPAAAGTLNSTAAGGDKDGGGPGPVASGTPEAVAGVAPRRQRGHRANWNAAGRMRAYLVAESCIKISGTRYRAVYDDAREKYNGALHDAECIRCGPKGSPKPAGSPLSLMHQHKRALRAVAKEILRDLWKEGRRLHGGPPGEGTVPAVPQPPVITQPPAAVAPPVMTVPARPVKAVPGNGLAVMPKFPDRYKVGT